MAIVARTRERGESLPPWYNCPRLPGKGHDMPEKFTDRALRTISLIPAAAARVHQSDVGPEHLLLAILQEGNGVAALLLRELGVDLSDAAAKIAGLAKSENDSLACRKQLDLAIDWALIEATLLKHDHIGTEHLLLGLLHGQEGPSADILRSFGLSVAQVRRELIKRLEP